MQSKSYLIFGLNNSLYGIETGLVQEVFYLPELTPTLEAPEDIVGLINLRGSIIPVMDLSRRFGQPSRSYQLSDSIIILQLQSSLIGVLVNQIHEVKTLDPTVMETAIQYHRGEGIATQFIAGLAKVDSQIITILDSQKLLFHQVALPPGAIEFEVGSASWSSSDRQAKTALRAKSFFELCSNLTAEDKAIFQGRAANLRQGSTSQDFSGLVALAVIGIGNEYFSLDLKVVREFTDIRKVTPIPCCPSHIVGNMNLRGEIVTLTDIQSFLRLSRSHQQSASQAMIIQVEDLVTGVLVDEVFDILYLNPTEIKPIPAAIHVEGSEFLKGTAPYRDKMMSILDICKIIQKGNLIVDEEV